MSAKFTPGPWSRDKYGHVIDAHGESILLRSVSIACSGKMVDEAEKNTNLIASAPDLLEALTAAVECGMVPETSAKEGGAAKYSRQVEVADMIRAAIAKAIGDPQ